MAIFRARAEVLLPLFLATSVAQAQPTITVTATDAHAAEKGRDTQLVIFPQNASAVEFEPKQATITTADAAGGGSGSPASTPSKPSNPSKPAVPVNPGSQGKPPGFGNTPAQNPNVHIGRRADTHVKVKDIYDGKHMGTYHRAFCRCSIAIGDVIR